MLWLMFCFAFHKKAKLWEKCLEMRILKFFIVCKAKLRFFSLSSLEETREDLLSLHQVFICKTHVLLHLCQFWTQF